MSINKFKVCQNCQTVCMPMFDSLHFIDVTGIILKYRCLVARPKNKSPLILDPLVGCMCFVMDIAQQRPKTLSSSSSVVDGCGIIQR